MRAQGQTLREVQVALTEVRAEHEQAMGALEAERKLRKDQQRVEAELARLRAQVEEQTESAVAAVRASRGVMAHFRGGLELESENLSRLLSEFGLLHKWCAELQDKVQEYGAQEAEGGADAELLEGFGLEGDDAVEVRLDGYGEQPGDALGKLVGQSILESMVARLGIKAQDVASLGLSLETSLRWAARALDVEEKEKADEAAGMAAELGGGRGRARTVA